MIEPTVLVPVIVALVSAVKTAGLPSKYAPILSILIGVAFFSFIGEDDLITNAFAGVLAGLGASGLYSGTRKFK